LEVQNLFQPEAAAEVISRIDKLQPTTQHQWGKFVISDKRDFVREQERLKGNVRQFHEGGEVRCTKHPHPFFGSVTPQEWATGMYKHLDHHLRQFGA
jgi:Protein of unknown function (DUF1569)